MLHAKHIKSDAPVDQRVYQKGQLCIAVSAAKHCARSKRLCARTAHNWLKELASETGEACAVSKALFDVLSLALAQLCRLLTRKVLPGTGSPYAPLL